MAKGIAAASMETGVPIAFGVITSDTIEQAVERAGTKSGNKGFDAAITAIEMAQLLKEALMTAFSGQHSAIRNFGSIFLLTAESLWAVC